jgi:hypothetical protein
MRTTTDVGQMFEAWLADDERDVLPERTLDLVAAALPSVRQVPGPGTSWFAARPWRRMAAMAIGLAVLAGGTAVGMALIDPPGPFPTPTPVVTASAVPSPSPLPSSAAPPPVTTFLPGYLVPATLQVMELDLGMWSHAPHWDAAAEQLYAEGLCDGIDCGLHELTDRIGASYVYPNPREFGDDLALRIELLPASGGRTLLDQVDRVVTASGDPGAVVVGPRELPAGTAYVIHWTFQPTIYPYPALSIVEYVVDTQDGVVDATFATTPRHLAAAEETFDDVMRSLRVVGSDDFLGEVEVEGTIIDLTGWSAMPSGSEAALMFAVIDLEGSFGVWEHVLHTPDQGAFPRDGYIAVIPGPTFYGGPDAAVLINVLPMEDGGLDAAAAAAATDARGGNGRVVRDFTPDFPSGPARKVRSFFTTDDGRVIQVVDYLVTNGDRIITLSFAAEQPHFGELQEAFRRAAASVR